MALDSGRRHRASRGTSVTDWRGISKQRSAVPPEHGLCGRSAAGDQTGDVPDQAGRAEGRRRGGHEADQGFSRRARRGELHAR
jgi:hypothetical protein